MAAGPQIFGIRHHGPGSARSLRRALEALAPDIVLVEGPPDAAEVLPLLAHPEMRPPVALLLYASDAPQHASYYPFAQFSPEWQALDYALGRAIPVRFMDLPQRHRIALDLRARVAADQPAPDALPAADGEPEADQIRRDPIGALAAAAGYSDGERWWEHIVEQRSDDAGLFAAILEAMSALRAATTDATLPHAEQLREAWMRQTIRQAIGEGFATIAVVCGAWHSPALTDLSQAVSDNKLLQKLPSVAVHATWVPWTYARLAYRSGYGAGIESPGWYAHLWQASAQSQPPTEVAVRWLTRVARLLRDEDLAASSASVIEAVRLAEALAALRDRPLPGLVELNEAARAVFCLGAATTMQLIHEHLIVGEVLGAVPASTPMAPLQQDLTAAQRRLRLPAEANWRDYDLDLRKPNDLARSQLLHRLTLLTIPWGTLQRAGGGKGTFHELWRIEWQPELTIALIEAGIWGNTIAEAAAASITNRAQAADLPTLTRLLDVALLADLPTVVGALLAALDATAAAASDLGHLMDAIPPLVNILRYSDVRKTDVGAVAHVVDGLVMRAAVGLPGAAGALNDEAAAALFARLVAVSSAIDLLENADLVSAWRAALLRLADQHDGHGLVAGRAVRLLLDARAIDADETARRLGLALARASDPTSGAAWIAGLIRDSGALLVHDTTLWRVLDGWVAALDAAAFVAVLPLLRRTFADFGVPERRALGERASRAPDARPAGTTHTSGALDSERAERALVVVTQLLGLRA